jgi:ribonucleoside-diphosphate reductase alpha chain
MYTVDRTRSTHHHFGVQTVELQIKWTDTRSIESKMMTGSRCPGCGNSTLIRKDGCDYCTACGFTGTCG